MKFIVEHLDLEVFDWCFLEYKHISEIVGKNNVLFTGLKRLEDQVKMKPFGAIEEKRVKELGLKRIIILDPDAEKTLTKKDCEDFDYLLVGGILGEYPAKKRTKTELSTPLGFEKRNLGDKQMSTDTAVLVAQYD